MAKTPQRLPADFVDLLTEFERCKSTVIPGRDAKGQSKGRRDRR